MDEECAQRLTEWWKFDADDGPAIGPHGSEEQDPVLVDDFDSEFSSHTISLMEKAACRLSSRTIMQLNGGNVNIKLPPTSATSVAYHPFSPALRSCQQHQECTLERVHFSKPHGLTFCPTAHSIGQWLMEWCSSSQQPHDGWSDIHFTLPAT